MIHKWSINYHRIVTCCTMHVDHKLEASRTGDLCATWAMTPMKRGPGPATATAIGKSDQLEAAMICQDPPWPTAMSRHQNSSKSCKIHHKIHHKIHQRYIALWENNGKCGKSWTHHWRWRLALATWKAWMLAKPCWLKLERSMFGMSLVDQVKEMKQFCSSAIKRTWKMNHLSLGAFQIFKDL